MKCSSHDDSMPMQHTASFHGCKNDNFPMKKMIFLIFAQNIGRGYTLEVPTNYALEQK